ncbi:protein kinase [Exilibacterium tricleocarpae]|uniref:non-specific serine/threonine protein kinase n=1 Tax=Exilibacterium tricleocarpae TaxID=2591008 RepID=A0A545U5L5_9GAMM|nr:protein kinase [Exilibacterium tricleocarpae]TQV84759.1 protein kinase [Exilibacterium tricleocarpae]
MKTDIPGYKIIRTLGQGGMATVYLAIQVSFEREVALKVMSPALSADPAFGERFSREARIVSRLVHPNIVTVYDVGVHEGQHFLSMEYVPGQDLKQKRQRLSHRDAVRVVKDVARALDFAGKKGYVHRDVKPENIMLHEEDGRAVLMDFGIARPTDTASGMTQTGTAIGTPHYMSPEQAKGKPVDLRSDLYSLGVVLYLLLVGRVPFDADSAVAVGIKHVADPIPRLPDALERFQRVIDRVLAKDPEQRYQNGAQFIADLNTITDTELAAMAADQRPPEPPLGNVDTTAPTVVSGTAAAVAEAKKKPAPDTKRALSPRSRALPESKSPRAAAAPASAASSTPPPPAATAAAASGAAAADHRADFHHPREHSPILPWLAGGLVAVAVATFVYVQQNHPQVLDTLWTDADPQPQPVAAAPAVAVSREADSAPAVAVPEPADRVQEATAGVADGERGGEQPGTAPATPADSTLAVATGSAGNAGATIQAGTAAVGPVADRVRELRKQLEQDLSVAPELAQVYRDILEAAPDNQQARWGLKQLQDYHQRQLRQSLEAGDLPRVRLYLDSARASFPAAVEADDKYQRLIAQLEQAEQHRQWLEQGNRYLAEDALGAPAGANALERFRAVLAADPDNRQAQQGLQAVAARYGVLAQRQLRAGEFERARSLLDRGLAVMPDDNQLQELAQAVAAQRRALRQRQQQVAEARQLMDQGRLITPRQASAFDLFRAVLAEHPGDPAAQRGLEDIERLLVERIATQIEARELESARQQLVEAQSRLTGATALQTLQVELELAFESKALAELPKIPEVIVSNAELTSITARQADTLQVDRTIHIGFRYQNFAQATSVVQAILYDGARSLQIAQVPVIVSGNEGVTFFRIDRPVAGFAEGGYNIDLLLGGDRLTTAAFKVESGAPIP